MKNSEPWQRSFAFADNPQGSDEVAEEVDGSISEAASLHIANDKGREETRPSEAALATGLLDKVASLATLQAALTTVARNKGAPGVDKQTVEDVVAHASTILPAVSDALLSGNYVPGAIRRAWIPKSGGGRRGLGIPNVVDRVVQQAVLQVLEPIFEPTFHPSSHGFRRGRSCHTAIAEASKHVTVEQRRYVVDIDLKNFFDQVNHQRLLARMSQRIADRGLLRLIGQMLKAKVVLEEGVCIPTKEGVPQGGPLSPLLSNIVLDELDWELERRGLRFVRYADDCNIYVGSQRAGQRVLSSIRRFLARRLRLAINEEKSAVTDPWTRHFLGFRIGGTWTGRPRIQLSQRTLDRFDQRLNALTRRNAGRSLRRIIIDVNTYLRGWMGFFHPCTHDVLRTLHYFDGHIRRRLRAIVIRQKKRPRYLYRHLVALGVSKASASKTAFSRRGPWQKSHSHGMEVGYPTARFRKLGLVNLAALWKEYNPRVADGSA